MRTLIPLLLVAACTDGHEPSGLLSMLTYNVQGLPDPLTDSDRPGTERMPAIATLLEPYDVVGLQEDFIEENHLLLTDTSHPERRWFSAKTSSEKAFGSGLSALSRPTITAYVEIHYEQCHGILDGASDCLASKGFQVATLDLGGVLLDVINTHHEAGGGPLDIAARESQVEQVIAALDARPDRAVVFLGDMNLRPSDPDDQPALARYASVGLRDACAEVACPEDNHIDQIYVRDGADLTLTVEQWNNVDPTFRFAEGDPMSDHPPISAIVRWDRVR
jgi:endonuclease/exonuclease/phosphatase family metal-dependent hydrolase